MENLEKILYDLKEAKGSEQKMTSAYLMSAMTLNNLYTAFTFHQQKKGEALTQNEMDAITYQILQETGNYMSYFLKFFEKNKEDKK